MIILTDIILTDRSGQTLFKNQFYYYQSVPKPFPVHLSAASCVLKMNALRQAGVAKVLASWAKFNKNKLIASEDLRACWKAKVNTIRTRIRIRLYSAYPTFMLSGTWQIVSRGEGDKLTLRADFLKGWERVCTSSTSVDQYLASGEDLCQLIWLRACHTVLVFPTWQLDLDARSQCPRPALFPATHMPWSPGINSKSRKYRLLLIWCALTHDSIGLSGCVSRRFMWRTAEVCFRIWARSIKHIKVPFAIAIKVKSIRLLDPRTAHRNIVLKRWTLKNHEISTSYEQSVLKSRM